MAWGLPVRFAGGQEAPPGGGLGTIPILSTSQKTWHMESAQAYLPRNEWMNNYTLLRQLAKIWLDFMRQNSEDQKTRSWTVLQRKESALGFSQQLKTWQEWKCVTICVASKPGFVNQVRLPHNAFSN